MLNYLVYHQASNAPWLAFIPGYTGSLQVWNTLCEQLLQQREYSILLIDNLGAGQSPQPPGKYTTDLMANEVLNVINTLDIKNVCLIGHSLGGAIALKLALKNQHIISHLVLLSAFAKLDQVGCQFLQARYELMKHEIDGKLVALNIIPSLFANDYLMQSDKIEFAIQRTINNPQTIDGMRGQLTACIEHDATDCISDIECKTTIITGADDILVNPSHSEVLHKAIANSSIHKINNCGHMVQLEKTAILAQLISYSLAPSLF